MDTSFFTIDIHQRKRYHETVVIRRMTSDVFQNAKEWLDENWNYWFR